MEQARSARTQPASLVDLGTALATVAQQLCSGTALSAQQLLRAEGTCLDLFATLGAQAAQSTDPRLALAHAIFAQAFSQRATAANIAAASLVETTAAHALDLQEFENLHAGTTDFSAPPCFAPGRTVYRDAPTVLAALLDLNYFEADRRVKDAHLLYARKDISGAACAPRFTKLAQCFAGSPLQSPHDAPATAAASTAPGGWALPDLHQLPDPREVLKTARALDKFEPEDATFDGLPSYATAKAADGSLLEDQAAAHLRDEKISIRQKRINGLIKDYKDAHQQTKTPKLGLFRGKVVNGVHEYIIRVRELDAELWESLIAQADNKRTQAGAAARKAAGLDTGTGTGSQEQESAEDQPHPENFDGDDNCAGDEAASNHASEEDSSHEESPDEEQPGEQAEGEQQMLTDELWSSDQPPPPWAGAQSQDSQNADPPDSKLLAPPVLGTPDTCTVPERRLNALNAILRNIGPGSSGKRITPEIVVHARYEDLQDLGSLTGITAHGIKLSAPQLRTMLCEAKVLSPIYNADGVIMDIGRDSRLFPRWMKLAARDRDGGCLVPGCTMDPALIEFHHFEPWAKGGRTRLQDCCPLCSLHHTMVHAGYLKLVKIKGLPYVILPKHLDPQQLPRRNTYFARA